MLMNSGISTSRTTGAVGRGRPELLLYRGRYDIYRRDAFDSSAKSSSSVRITRDKSAPRANKDSKFLSSVCDSRTFFFFLCFSMLSSSPSTRCFSLRLSLASASSSGVRATPSLAGGCFFYHHICTSFYRCFCCWLCCFSLHWCKGFSYGSHQRFFCKSGFTSSTALTSSSSAGRFT